MCYNYEILVSTLRFDVALVVESQLYFVTVKIFFVEVGSMACLKGRFGMVYESIFAFRILWSGHYKRYKQHSKR